MNLRLKSLITVACLLIIVLGSIASFAYYYNEQSYRSLESVHTVSEVNRTVNTIQDDMLSLYSNVRDYAAWNDTYTFARDANQKYSTDNFRNEVFTLYSTDYILVFNRTGGLVYGKGYEKTTDTGIAEPASLTRDIAHLNSINGIFDSYDGSTGILNSSIGPVIVISHPILTDTFEGPPAGSIHFIRKINSAFYKEILDKTGHQISIVLPETLREDTIFTGQRLQLPEDGQTLTYPVSGDLIKGVTNIPDLANQTNFFLVVDNPRTIYNAGHTSVVLFISLLIIASGIIIIFVIFLLDRIVFSKLNNIIKSLKKTIENSKDNVSHPNDDHDEIKELAEAVDPVFYHLSDIQRRIRESEERYRTIFDNMQDVFYRLDLNGNILMMSPKGPKILGYSSLEEVIGRNVREFYVHTHDVSAIEDVLQNSGIIHNYEITLRSLSGEQRKFYANSHYIYDTEGNAIGREGILHDVTELKKAEVELLESKKRYQSLVETISDCIWEIDKTGCLTYVSPQIKGIIGYDAETLVGKTPGDLLPPDEAERVIPEFTRYLQLKEPFPGYECRVYHADGHQIYLETNGEAIFDQEGNFTGFRGVIRDITHRKTIEKRLQDSEQSYRELFDSIREAIYILDLELRFLTVNEGAVLMNGYPSEHYIGKTPDFLSPPGENDPDLFLKHMPDTITETSRPFEFRCLRKSGDIYPQMVRLSKGMYFGQEVIIAIGVDISDRKKSEEAIKLANKKLNLLASITRHDINNQLQAMMVYLDSSRYLIADHDQLLGIFEKEDMIIRNIQQQIAFTKDYETLGVHAPKWQNIRHICYKITNQLPLQNVRLEYESQDILIFADTLLEKVFYNLVHNALSYGGEKMDTITISATDEEDGLHILVEDNGAGIREEDKEMIFEKGFGRNTGLGLFLSREILSITNISITETGVFGEGARFEMTVPKGSYSIKQSQT